MKVKVKVMADTREGVERFLAEIDDKFLAATSTAKPSSQGGFHGYATVVLED